MRVLPRIKVLFLQARESPISVVKMQCDLTPLCGSCLHNVKEQSLPEDFQ